MFGKDCWVNAKVRKNCEKCDEQTKCREDVTAYAKSLGIDDFKWTPPNLTKAERIIEAEKRLRIEAPWNFSAGAGEVKVK
jgi:hypothetical protein